MPSSKNNKNNKYNATAWGGSNLVDLDVPSGQLCQVRRVGPQGLIRAGLIDSLDVLTAMVQTQTLPKAQGKRVVDAAELIKDKDKLNAMMELTDKVVEHVVVQPAVKRPVTAVLNEDDEPLLDEQGNTVERPLTDEERDPDVVYTDYIDIEDKMYIFQFAVGGTSDFAQFRAESKKALGSLHGGEADEHEAE